MNARLKLFFLFLSILLSASLHAMPPTLVSVTSTDPLCLGVDNGSIVVSATGAGVITYSIDNGANFQSSNVFSNLAPGTYDVVVQDGTGQTTQTIVLTYQKIVIASFVPSVTSGVAILNVNFANTSTGATDYSWSLDGGNMNSTQVNPSFSYDMPGIYTVTLVASDNQCMDTATSLITVTGVSQVMEIPNVFSPNGDGQNDVFSIASIGIKTMQVFIYNRYGEIVYEWFGKSGVWDGYTYPAGQAVPAGTYYYYMKATGFDQVEYDMNGQLTLLR